MRKIKAFISFILFAVLLLSVTPVMAEAAPETPLFQIDFIDVGQGDAALVSCDGHYMLIDGGKAERSSLIYSYLKKRNIKNLDYIVATHADADHVGGLAGALNYANVGTAYCSETSHDTRAFKSFVKYLNAQGKDITVPSPGEQFSLGSAAVAVLGPIRKDSESNNNSIVLRIVYGRTSFLFTGDAEEAEEKDILKRYGNLQSTVLKVAHHGSSSSSSYLFLRSVAPQYAVISVGSDNTYGHPTEQTLSRLRDADVKTYRTDMQGTVICTSDGTTVSFQTEKNKDADTLADSGPGQKSALPPVGVPAGSATDGSVQKSQSDSQPAGTYILNTNTKKFHYPECSSVSDMKEKNKKVFQGTSAEAQAMGYVPCKRCNPQ